MSSNRPLRIAVSALTALVVGAFGLSTWRDHELSRHEAENELTEVVRLLDEHTNAALLACDLQISRARDRLGGRLPAELGADERDAMVALTRGLKIADAVWIFDADANVRATNHQLPPTGLNVADRVYFQALRDGTDSFISPLIWGKLNNAPFFTVSRRVDAPDGRFAGGILVSLNTDYFTEFYRNLNPRPGAIFAIYKDDGRLVMRSSLPPDQDASLQSSKLVPKVVSQGAGIYAGASSIDGVKRLYAFRRMAEHQLVLAAGVPMSEVFAGWRERTLRNGIIAAVVLAAFLTIAAKLADTLRREAELRGRAEGLLAEKDMLFQEIHHRVKNNLQIIASFLTMQAVHSRDEATAAAFEEALSRLQSMGLVHQILYEQNEATEVSMEAYLRALGTTIGQTFGADTRGIAIEVAPSDARLAMDQAVPLALLANEALTNALKHAFPPGQGGSIRMELAERDGTLAFSLADDGIGMPEGAKSGLGMTILSALARQLGGTLEWAVGSGTRLTVTVPV